MRLIGVGETCTKTLTMTLQISMGLSPGSSKSALVGICKTASAKIQLLNTEKTRVEKYITFAYFSIRNVGIAKWSQRCNVYFRCNAHIDHRGETVQN